MKKVALLLISTFIYHHSFAADSLITRLVNSIYSIRVDSTAKYYYLLDSAKNPEFDEYTIKELSGLKHLDISQLPLKEFIFNIKNDSSKISWKDFFLTNAKCVDKGHLPKYKTSVRVYRYVTISKIDSDYKNTYSDGVINIFVKPHRSKRQLVVAKDIAIKKYEKRPLEEKSWYYFSKPIFSSDKRYVLISLHKNGEGCDYIFKLEDGKWKKVLQFTCWTT